MRSEARFFLVLIFLGMALVMVGAVTWNTPVDVFYGDEEVYHQYNLSMNVSNVGDNLTIVVDTASKNITWDNGTLNFSYLSLSSLPWVVYDSNNFLVNINITNDNETGKYYIPFLAGDNITIGTLGENWFQINATNDIPYFLDLNSSYDFPQSESGFYTVNAFDEESHYPLDFNLTFLNNCTHASWSGRNPGENCSIFNLSGSTSTSTDFDFNPVRDDVGTYWAEFSVKDFNGTCPHSFCDSSSYDGNKSSGVFVLKFNVYSALTLNVSNCSGASITEGDTFNCTIEITTRGEFDGINLSSYAFFSSNPALTYDSSNRDWFYSASSENASNFSYSLPISITPAKKEVGNWTINFSVLDVLASVSKVEPIEVFVDYIESDVSLSPISDISLYEDGNFSINATDDDLLIWDTSIKVPNEDLTFVSNTTWVSVSNSGTPNHNFNYMTSTVTIDHSLGLADYEGNHSVMINVSNAVGNISSQVFIVEIINDTAPVWNNLSDPVVLDLIEDSVFNYNVSVNVSDPGETLTFYYENLTEEFCSLNSTNFNPNGMISFAPTDCDVGFHNVSIISGNGKLNSSWNFVFNVSNIFDVPVIFFIEGDNGTGYDLDPGFNFGVNEGSFVNFSLIIDDDDFLIPDGQKGSYYDESILVNMTFMNSSGGFVDLFNFSFLEFGGLGGKSPSYVANFTPGVQDVGDYTVVVNVTDSAGNFTSRTWFLNVTEYLEPPILDFIDNVSLTVHDVLNFSVNASDDEDDFNGVALNYSIVALDAGSPDLDVGIVNGSVLFNMSSNVSYSGIWRYNLTVNDSDSMTDSQVFYLFVYGFANLVLPVQNSTFNLTENVSGVLNFTINHSVLDSLVYEFWIDNVSCPFQNNSNCSYGNLSFRESEVGLGNGSVFNWNFLPSFSDETYWLDKNLTVSVYPNSSLLSSNQSRSVASNFSFKLNVTHANAPIRAIVSGGTLQGNYGDNIDVDLSSYFADEDVSDPYWNEPVSFSKSSGDANIFVSHSSGWIAQVFTNLQSAFTGVIAINGSDNSTSDVVNDIAVTFTAPTTTRSSSSTKTVVKFFSIRVIVPEDVIISDENYIDVPFALENSGTMDLRGIDLSSEVLYNNKFSDDVKINLGTNYVDSLKPGERRDYSMRILADTSRAGRYKATIFANVSSPKFGDWGDFFIDLRRTNESEAEELLIFTEKIIADNPECLELTEVFRRAQEAFEAGNEIEAVRLAQEVSSACEDAISANEQIRYRLEGFVENNVYYISFITLIIFFIGFVFYVYKRVRFNKSVEDNYIR